MNKTALVTVSDDRFGRKNGTYAATQALIPGIVEQHVNIDRYFMVTWQDIEKSQFYKDNQILLQNKDAAKNGRAYKPYVIREALKELRPGDFLIYTDCSPEMWGSVAKFHYKLDKLKELCVANNGILTAFVKWDTRPIPPGGLGIHTHANFTTERCIERMFCNHLRNSFMHASGMVVLQKGALSLTFIDEWLYYNLDDACATMGDPNNSNDYSYWDEHENRYKMGHRHDQSISGLLINLYNQDCIDPVNAGNHTYNFLEYCIPSLNYKFINSNSSVEKRKIKKGDDVLNSAGVLLRVWEIWPSSNGEIYIVGVHRESAYQTTEDKLTVI
jgi:hypothetical protein